MSNTKQKIIPHLWFDKGAKEATEFYTSLFPDSKINSATILHDTPSGDAETVSFELLGKEFMAISGGPYFKFNPSISLTVQFFPAEAEKLKEVWSQLSEGGTVLMPLDMYPFSKQYGWIQDKYGLSWQLILVEGNEEARPKVIPSLLFVGENCGRAEEAINFYLSIFKHGKLGQVARYPKGMEPDKEGTLMFSDFHLEDEWFVAMDSGREHSYQFNEAISFIVKCEKQEEINYYWEKLSAVPEAEQCGWLKDKFGLSWQIVPTEMEDMMKHGTPEQLERVTKAFLQMKKFDLEALRKAFKGE